MRLAPLRSGEVISFALASLLLAATAAAQTTLDVGRFSGAGAGESLPEEWKPLTFKNIEKKTVYSLVADEGATVVKAVSAASASGLTREIKIDLKSYPIIQWRWKVVNVLKNADPAKKAGDDYPARVYITFQYDATKLSFGERVKYNMARLLYGQYPPHAGICYIWEGKTPQGSVLTNAYTGRLKMVVVQSGEARLNQWLSEQRNVYEDYKKAFHEEPPAVSGVAIMTDTDNTREAATAYYGDIVFKKPN